MKQNEREWKKKQRGKQLPPASVSAMILQSNIGTLLAGVKTDNSIRHFCGLRCRIYVG